VAEHTNSKMIIQKIHKSYSTQTQTTLLC